MTEHRTTRRPTRRGSAKRAGAASTGGTERSRTKRAGAKATGAKATGAKATGAKATGAKGTGTKAKGTKATGTKATGTNESPRASASKSAARVTGGLAEYRRKRDFDRTAEPRGGGRKPSPALAYVIQKHAASHLHFDLRLELDGVMKSWAVPKGPSLDPAVKRLAMQVEDHPIEYNAFEGTIPQGEYGGGTVMIWDRGSYRYGGEDAVDPMEGLREGYRRGDFKFVLQGRRLTGSWVLVRTRRGDPRRAQWLLIKHRDEAAAPGSDVVEEFQSSVVTGRTMPEIAAGRKPRGRRRAAS
ncbi:MAG TPA: DNA polymerase ligase N-terminal domain-containing protein [Gemmatimonadales bacterium]|nr:DNA polymerase ligase N-terminal domain-containing protein [Gemmatimonadales bacterium]